jgi:glycosyltransferase involved in cell wall biosynthesis
MYKMAPVESEAIDVSVVIPMRNEAPNVAVVCAEVASVLDAEPLRYEVIVVDDGSTDGTSRELQKVVGQNGHVTVLEFTRRFGQAAALAAGFRAARGGVVVAMDGDGQNDPRDIPRLVARLHELPACDVVSGWRKNRQDKWFSRRLPSLLANRLIRRRTWCHEIHDFGCTLKAYRRDVLRDIRLYGEMHRFLPAICKWRGARLSEVVVNHRSRLNGESKYGIGRTLRVLLDLLTVKFLGDYGANPIYFFGKVVMLTGSLAALAFLTALVQKLGYLTEHGDPVKLHSNVFIIVSMLMFVTTVSLLMMGVMSELLIRIYYESQDRPPYRIRNVWRSVDPQSPREGVVPETEFDRRGAEVVSGSLPKFEQSGRAVRIP